MKKKILIPSIALGVVIIALIALVNDREIEKDNIVFHITLADPKLYNNGIYADEILLEEGSYEFRFVPNGDSPEILDISLRGEQFEFSEEFALEGFLHETGISEYYTWDYSGTKQFKLESRQEIAITIDPKGNIVGPVSVDILKN